LDTIEKTRPICEAGVVKYCVAVKDQVWPMFLEKVAPMLKSAELIAEQKQRNNRIGDIADCFQRSCQSQFGEKDAKGYDACLGNPVIMVESCKVEMERAGVKANDSDPVWVFVRQKLGALRIDACTVQIKECIQNENSCGNDYAKCVGPRGMDLDMVKKMCPLPKLTACAEDGKMQTNWEAQLNDIAMGLFLQIDNAAMDLCVAAIEEEVLRVCDSLDSCDKPFNSSKIGEVLELDAGGETEAIIVGLVDLTKFEYCNPSLEGDVCTASFAKVNAEGMPVKDGAGKIQTTEGLSKYPTLKITGEGADGAPYTGASKVKSLANMQAIKRQIDAVTSQLVMNPKIKGCTEGRDLSQISGEDKNTDARFPHMLDPYLGMVIMSGLTTADKNYRAQLIKLKKDAEAAMLAKAEDAATISGEVCWVK
ncbi:MAG: hypothetical protein LBQ49_00005, partial [Rickettsiales bacterium]|nr:hypothetical protein [Rickettsiales bacterium]